MITTRLLDPDTRLDAGCRAVYDETESQCTLSVPSSTAKHQPKHTAGVGSILSAGIGMATRYTSAPVSRRSLHAQILLSAYSHASSLRRRAGFGQAQSIHKGTVTYQARAAGTIAIGKATCSA